MGERFWAWQGDFDWNRTCSVSWQNGGELELERNIYDWVLMGVFIAALVTVLALVFVSAPYGRHERSGWGPTIPSRIGWILMETPPVFLFLWVYFQGEKRFEPIPLLFLTLWQIHYVHRAYIFPFRLKIAGKKTPLLVVFLAIVFNVPNAYLNARWISHFGSYPTNLFQSPILWAGLLVFIVGLGINLHSDSILMNLRKPGEAGYKIPRGGFFRWVSAPNYLGELLEWLGGAIATWSLAGLSFCVYTAANLAPRALTNHRWYLAKFDDYPKKRRALIPFIF